MDQQSGGAVIVTGGDPAGISPEIILKAFQHQRGSQNLESQKGPNKGPNHNIHDLPVRPVIYFSGAGERHNELACRMLEGSNPAGARIVDVMRFQKESPQKEKISQHGDPYQATSAGQTMPQSLVVDLLTHPDLSPGGNGPGTTPVPGRPDERSGALAYLALELAVDTLQGKNTGEHLFGSLVTAPLSKEWVHRALQGTLSGEGRTGDRRLFTGHTGYLSGRTGRDVLMLMHGPRFGVVPLTVHIPLREVSDALRQALFSRGLIENLKRIATHPDYQKRPWALLSVNPHGGEGGVLGTEELDFMGDAVDHFQSHGLPVEGVFPADGAFQEGVRENYSLFLAAYHDQGLIPFKALEGQDGVNITTGLPFFRVSPDHGTAYSLAGTGRASARSMIMAFKLALLDSSRYFVKPG